MGPISSISPHIVAPSLAPATPPRPESGDFEGILSTSIQSMEAQGAQSREAVQQFLSGESSDVHKVAIATQKAELSAELFMQMRNKVISAYQEIMKMQM